MRDRSTLLVTYFRSFNNKAFATLIICLFALPYLIQAQPANNLCNNAQTVNTLDGSCELYDNTGATNDLLFGDCVNQAGAAINTWFQFTAIGTEITITADLNGAPLEITLLEFNPTNCDFPSAVQLGCSLSPLILPGALTVGNNYYIVITVPDNAMGEYKLCVDNFVPNPPPPNDLLCDFQTINANGGCVAGTTVNATPDYGNGDPACSGLFDNSVYYATTIGPGMNALDLDVQGLGGDVAITLLSLAPDCMNPPVILDYYCGNSGGLPLNITGLTENTTYYIQVSTSTIDEGAFQICATEVGPPPGCSLNDFCNQAEPISITSNQPCNPVSGCNIGASSEPGLTGCNMATEEVVWYSFTSDATAGLLSMTVTSLDITQPTVQLFTGTCGAFNDISGCITGNNGQASIVNQSISPNTNYLLAISNSFGLGGNFELCVLTFTDISACSTESELYVAPGSPSLGSPDNGPYQPNETVTFCFNLISYVADPIGTGNNCQWLQGIVPVFGDCWDPTMFDPTASEPPSLYGGNWDWHTNITYNNNNPNITIDDCDGNGTIDICHITEPSCCNTGTTAGTIVPPGWFADMGGSPNNTFGDGSGCGVTMGPWEFCFEVTTKPFPDCSNQPSFTDCSVKIYTFADGETGSWSGGPSTCAQDIPQVQNNVMNCCEGPTVNPGFFEVCNGGGVFIPLTSNQDPDVSYSWTVSPSDSPPNPNQYGASSGTGTSINQTLSNTTGSPVTVIYTVTPVNNTEGCFGTPVDMEVTIYPEIQVFIDPVVPVCAGQCASLSVNASGGSENFLNYTWDNGLGNGANVQACPSISTTYTVTVTDNLGCTGEGSVTVQANSNLILAINADPGTTICDNDPAFPIFLEAVVNSGGSGSYDYLWSNGGSNSITTANETDTYSVTVTDLSSGCTGEQFIDITVNEEPFAEIIPPSQVCVTETDVCFLAFPGGGTWGGDVDAGGCTDPSVLGPGIYTVTYTYIDAITLCSTIATYDYTVDDVPAAPETLNSTTICSGGPPSTYTVTAVPGAFSYTWTVPADASIVNGQGTNSIMVDWGISAGGQVCVTADNDCGASLPACFDITITSTPTTPVPPAPVTVCAGALGEVYTIPNDPAVTNYLWIVPAGATITAGQGTNTITVNWGTATSGQICINANNSCGSSPPACFDVTIDSAPATPTPPTDAVICAGAMNDIYTITAVPGATGYTWTIPAGATIAAGQGTTSITINWGTATSGQVCVTADNLCGSSAPGCFNVAIGTIPAPPIPPTPVTVCAGDMNDSYSITPVATATSYTWTVPTGATISGGQGTTSITMNWGTAVSGQVCITADNNCGSSAPACFDVTVDDIPAVPQNPSDATICIGETNDPYTVTAVSGATSYTWTVPGGASIATGQGTNSITVNWGTATSGQVCVTANNNCGSSATACNTITFEDIPAIPTPPNDATICAGLTSDTYSITTVTGATTYNWTIPTGATITSGQGTTTIDINWGTATTGQICVSAGNNCGDSNPACANVNIGDVPNDPVAPTDDNVCAGTPNSNYAIAPVANATDYDWTVPAGASIINGQGTTSINVDWATATSGQICVSAINDCGSSNPVCFDVVVDEIPDTPTPPNPATICAGLEDDTYTITDVTGATSYTWTVPGGASITSGQGTTSIDIDWNAATSGQICVSADNDCGMSTPACFDVTIEDVPAEPVPPLDGTICEGTQNDTYTIADVPNATDYDWTVPGGASITSGQGSTSIEIDWGTASSGQVCVTASNNCGDSPQACFDITIDETPQAPIAPSNETICAGLQNDTYTISSVPGATGYTWTVPGGATITSGQGNSSIDIDWGTATSGQVCVFAFNDCGDSPDACFDVTIDEAPQPPNPSGDDAVCAGEASSDYSITSVSGADDYTWTVPTGASISSGQGTTSIDVDWGTATSGQVCVTANNDCGSSPQACFDVTVNTIPSATFTVNSPICITDATTVTYTGGASAGAIYTWNFNGGVDNTGATGAGPYEVEWATASTYTISLTVEENGCVSTQEIQMVTVEAPLPDPVISCTATVNSVEFTWDAIPGVTEYLVNNVSQAGTSYTETGLTSGDVVVITVIAVGNGACGNSEATADCTAADCLPVDITVDPVADICLDANAGVIILSATATGGAGGGTDVWEGNGITNATTGEFDPNDPSVVFGSNIITYTYSEGPCDYSGTTEIIVNQQPTADFTFDSPVCSEDTITINYTGNADALAFYDWDFGAADYIDGSGSGPYEVHWPTGGNINISLTVVSANNCSSLENIEILTVDEPLAEPVITCVSGTDFIDFSWPAIPGATGYLVNNVPQAGTTYSETGLSAGDMVTITVVAVGDGACGNSQATQTCTADDCPPVTITIDAVAPICLDANAASFNLFASTMGGLGNGTGVWQGPGIVDANTGEFNPLAPTVNIGINTVTYFYDEGDCPYSQSIDIIVNAQPASTFIAESPVCAGDLVTVTYTGTYDPLATYDWNFGAGVIVNDLGSETYEIQFAAGGDQSIDLQVTANDCASEVTTEIVMVDNPLPVPVITCTSTTTSVTFTWDAIPGANGYTVNDIPQGGTSYSETGLSTGDVVVITVVAIGTGACGDSEATADCVAENCPTVTIDINPVADLCQDPTASTITLTALVTGGTNGTGFWDGPGIIDPALGTFDVNAVGVTPGINTVTYFYSEPPCNYNESIDINVNAVPSSDFSFDSPICAGDIISVSYNGVFSATATYDWDFGTGIIDNDLGSENYMIEFPTNGNPTISLTVTDNGCTSVINAEDIQIDAPLSVPAITCMSTTTSVEFSWPAVTGATGYLVNNVPQAGTSYSETGLSTGDVVTITVVALGTGACGNSEATADCTASSCPNIELTITPIADICLDAMPTGNIDLEVLITGSNNTGTGIWTGNGIVDATAGLFNPDDPFVNNGENIIVFTFEEENCMFSTTIPINVFAQPTVDAGVDDLLNCANPSLILSGSGSGTPSWSGGPIDLGGDTYSPTISTPGIYILTVTDPSGCTATDEVTIDADASFPVAIAGEDTFITCDSSEVTLMASGTLGGPNEVTWSGPGIVDPTASIQIVDQPGMYILTITNTDFNCVSAPDTLIVGENTIPPNAVIQFIGSLDCFTTSVTLSADVGPNTYFEWLTPDGTILTDQTIQGTIGGTYTLTVVDLENGCTNFDTAVLDDFTAYPIVEAGNGQELDCANPVVTLDGTGSQTGPTIIYEWTGPAGGITGPTDQLMTTAILPGMYILSVEDEFNSCMNSDTVIITENINTPTAEAGETQSFGCIDDELSLSGAGSLGGNSYSWTDIDGSVISTSVDATVTEAGWYYLTVINTVSTCEDTDSVFIDVDNNVPFDLAATVTNPTCFGDNDGVILIDEVFGGTGPYTYSLDGENYVNFAQFAFLSGGNYTVYVEDSEGCTFETDLTVVEPAELQLVMAPELDIQMGQDGQIETAWNISDGAIDTLIWTNLEFLNCGDDPNCFDPVLDSFLLYTTTFTATLIDTLGCSDEESITVSVIKDRPVYIPNAFSPNGDGINDLFMIYSGDFEIKEIQYFNIFNRWGEVVYEASNFQPEDPDYAWDGIFNGKALNPGVYVYVAEIEFIDGVKILYKGDVTIMK